MSCLRSSKPWGGGRAPSCRWGHLSWHGRGDGADPWCRRRLGWSAYIPGLAAAGMPGVVRLFEILEDEIRICLSLFDASEQIPFRAGNLDDAVLSAASATSATMGASSSAATGWNRPGESLTMSSLLSAAMPRRNSRNWVERMMLHHANVGRGIKPQHRPGAGRDPANYRVSRQSVPAVAEPAGRTRDPREPGIARDRAPAETRRSRAEWCVVP